MFGSTYLAHIGLIHALDDRRARGSFTASGLLQSAMYAAVVASLEKESVRRVEYAKVEDSYSIVGALWR